MPKPVSDIRFAMTCAQRIRLRKAHSFKFSLIGLRVDGSRLRSPRWSGSAVAGGTSGGLRGAAPIDPRGALRDVALGCGAVSLDRPGRPGPLGLAALSACLLVLLPISAARAGSIEGRIRAGASIKSPPALDVAIDAWICGKDGKTPDPTLVIGAERGLANVVVSIVGPGPKPPFKAGQIDEDAHAVLPTVDQKGCIFEPHVILVAPEEKLRFTNSDATLHNVHTKSRNNRSVNKAQLKGAANDLSFKTPDTVRVECDVHYWMSAVVVVADSAWTSLSSVDGGFKINDLPAGKYTLNLWHERLGTRTLQVTVGDDTPTRLSYVWKADPEPIR